MPEHKIGTREEWQAARDELARLEAGQGERTPKAQPAEPAAGARTNTRSDVGPGRFAAHNRHEAEATVTPVDQRQPVNLYDAARGLRWRVREVPDGWTHPRWPGRTYNKPVHPAAQINQIGGLSAVTESLRPPTN